MNNLFFYSLRFRHIFYFLYVIVSIICKRKGVFTLKKLGTITVSVFKSDDNITDFRIETDNDNVLPVSYVIEDTLKLY